MISKNRLKKRHHLLPLWMRIFAVNGLVLVVLAASLLAMGGYQKRLIASETDALAMQAKLVANALGESSVVIDEKNADVLSPLLARFIVRRLAEASGAQIRLFDSSGALIAQSDTVKLAHSQSSSTPPSPLPSLSTQTPESAILNTASGAPPTTSSLDVLDNARQGLLNLFDRLDRFYEQNRWPVWPDVDLLQEPDLASAPLAASIAKGLSGQSDHKVWSLRQGGLVFTVALPVQRVSDVLGVVVLARPDTRLDAAVLEIRLAIIRLFAVALALTVLFSLYLTRTLARPLQSLARAADRVCHHATTTKMRGSASSAQTFLRHDLIPDLSWRGDEIGDLSKALRAMTEALAQRIRAIETFAADVAHELKNPLTSLGSAVETAMRIQDPERQRTLMAVIQDDVHRLNRLITDIAEASRLDASLVRADMEPVNLGDLLPTIVEGYGRNVHGKESSPQAALQLNFLPQGEAVQDAFYVRGIKSRLEQVMRNLLDNALSFSPADRPVIIDVYADRVGIMFCIRDKGPGIPPARLEKIFERFYTERPRGEKFGTHSGLGLSIARQIVEAHNGTLTARNETEPDGRITGACFVLTLPRSASVSLAH